MKAYLVRSRAQPRRRGQPSRRTEEPAHLPAGATSAAVCRPELAAVRQRLSRRRTGEREGPPRRPRRYAARPPGGVDECWRDACASVAGPDRSRPVGARRPPSRRPGAGSGAIPGGTASASARHAGRLAQDRGARPRRDGDARTQPCAAATADELPRRARAVRRLELSRGRRGARAALVVGGVRLRPLVTNAATREPAAPEDRALRSRCALLRRHQQCN